MTRFFRLQPWRAALAVVIGLGCGSEIEPALAQDSTGLGEPADDSADNRALDESLRLEVEGLEADAQDIEVAGIACPLFTEMFPDSRLLACQCANSLCRLEVSLSSHEELLRFVSEFPGTLREVARETRGDWPDQTWSARLDSVGLHRVFYFTRGERDLFSAVR